MNPESFTRKRYHSVPVGSVTLPHTFFARSEAGDWQEIPMSREPIFALAIDFAQYAFHNGSRRDFQNVSGKSASMAAINNALKADASLKSL